MKKWLMPGMAAALLLASVSSMAQDAGAAAERARIANQRIIAESERRRIESEQRRERQEQGSGSIPDDGGDPAENSAERSTAAPASAARPAPPRPPETAPAAEAATPASRPAPPRPPAEPEMAAGSQEAMSDPAQTVDDDAGTRIPTPTSEMLEQLRDLGELRDAGYVTEAEFESIKQRILNGGR